jgi:hypothetical protein
LPAVTPTNALPEAKTVLRIGIGQTSQLAELPRPAGGARSTTASLVAVSRQGTELVRELIGAIERKDSAALARLTAASTKLNGRFNAIARRLGARVCAENPQPGG